MRRIFNLIENSPAMRASQVSTAPAQAIEAVQSAWAQALRCEDEKKRDAQLCQLADSLQELAELHPDDAKVQLWKGIVLTGYAKALGGLCALQLQASARKSLERAIDLAPQDGAAYLYLGLLYDHAPASPYSFGDEQTARELLEKGLALTLQASRPLRYA